MEYHFKKGHNAEALVIMCMDFRFENAVNQYVNEELGLKSHDLVAIAGASKSLVDPLQPADRETILEQIALSIKLHHIPRVVLIDHADCGAYGGVKAFGSLEKEKEAQSENMRKAAALIRARHLGVRVDLIYANLSGEEIVFEKIT